MNDVIEEKKVITTREIKGTLDKEKLTFFDIQSIFEYITSRLKKDQVGYMMLNSVSTEIQQDIESAINKVAKIGDSMMKLENKICDEMDESYNRIENKWKETQEKINATKSAMEKISFPKLELPYNWKEFYEMIEKFSQLNDEQRDAFIKMSQALQKK